MLMDTAVLKVLELCCCCTCHRSTDRPACKSSVLFTARLLFFPRDCSASCCSVPFRFVLFRFSFLFQAVMQGLTNVSMMYLNYPAKVLFKSSRMVPIMCFGVVWQVT